MAETRTLARPYARALFELARKDGDLAQWSTALSHLSEIVAEPHVRGVLDSPQVTSAQRADIIIAIAGDVLGEQAKNFIRLLSINHRLPLVPDIAVDFETLRARSENLIEVELRAPTPVDDAEQTRFRDALQKRLGRDIKLHCEVDQSLLGGAIIRAGDLVIDGSLRSKLRRLSTAMIH